MSFRNAIDSRTALPAVLDYEMIRFQTHTGRPFLISDRGYQKKYGYRHGVETPIGDIEEKLWCELMKELIAQNEETELYTCLHEWYKGESFAGWTKFEQEFHTLQCFSYRIFDNEQWVDYIPFNAKYRPEILAARATDLLMVKAGNRAYRAIFHVDLASNTGLSCMGQLCLDFGSDGLEFQHTWDAQATAIPNDAALREDVLSVVDELRPLVLQDLCSIRKYLQENRGNGDEGWVQNYGYVVETGQNRYYLRCLPGEGRYQASLTCYWMQEKGSFSV